MRRKHFKADEGRERCPCCNRSMRKSAFICGFCFYRLRWDTQNLLHEEGPGVEERRRRFLEAVRKGVPLEEIWL